MKINWPWSKKAKNPTSQVEDAFISDRVAQMLITQAQSGRVDWSAWLMSDAIKQGYKSSSVVYACLTAIMEAMASVPWLAYKRDLNAERRTVKGWRVPEQFIPVGSDDPLQKLIDRPNPFWSWQQLVEMEAAHLHLGGVSPLYKVRVGRQYDSSGQPILYDATGKPIVLGPPVELWLLSPDTIAPVPDAIKYISHYIQKLGTGNQRMIAPSDLILFKLPDPANERWGISPLMAGGKAVDTDREAVDFNMLALKNRGVHNEYYNFKSNLSDDQWKENTLRIKSAYQGKEKAYAPLVLSEPDLEFKQLNMNLVDLDFLSGRKFTAIEICMLFRVPPAVVGLYQTGAAKAESSNSHELFWLNTVIPRLTRIQETLNRQLSADFGPDYWIGFDVSGVEALSEVFARKVVTATKMFTMGYPVNIINERLGLNLPSIQGGDQGWVAANLIPTTTPDESGSGGLTG